MTFFFSFYWTNIAKTSAKKPQKTKSTSRDDWWTSLIKEKQLKGDFYLRELVLLNISVGVF